MKLAPVDRYLESASIHVKKYDFCDLFEANRGYRWPGDVA